MDQAIPNRNNPGAVLITWSAAPWVPAESPPPLNATHLRLVPPPEELLANTPGSDAATADGTIPDDRHDASQDLADPAGIPATPAPSPEEAWKVQQLEQELAACRDEVEALHQMLEDLPDIFERKFRQRLQPVLEHQQSLITENRLLREQVFALGAGAQPQPPRQLPPAREPRLWPGQRLLRALQRQSGT